MGKVAIFLSESEYDALSKLAGKEYRDIRSQAAYIIQQELERRGALSKEQQVARPAPINDKQPLTA